MTNQISLFRYIDGYNPPNQYILLQSSNDVTTFKNSGSPVATLFEATYNIDGSLAEVTLSSSKSSGIYDTTIIMIEDYDTWQFYVGNVVKRTRVSADVVKFLINIDWYTSAFCTAYSMHGDTPTDYLPKADHYMERRSKNGRFTYKDEGFKPRSIMNKRSDLYVTIDSNKYNLFYTNSGGDITYILIYRMSAENCTLWIGYYDTFSIGDEFKNAKALWEGYCTSRGITTNATFNSKNVIFFGVFPMNYHIIPTENVYDSKYIDFGKVGLYEHAVTTAAPPTKHVTMKFPTAVSKDYDRYEIRDIDGSVLFEYKVGVNSDEITSDFDYVDSYLNFDIVTPSLTFVTSNVYYSGSRTFTITAKPVTEFIDTESVYNAEQRVYNQEMRSFTALNNLVSGLTGSLTEGAMMSAFSRSSGTQKGVIGGGVSAIGAGINYAYTELYANKKQTEIEDKNAKMQADTLLFSSDVTFLTSSGGVWEVKYDDDTISQITKYQSEYGYQSDAIKTDLVLNDSTFDGYIQADITMQGGFRKEVEDYICKMFSYGITFRKISTSS